MEISVVFADSNDIYRNGLQGCLAHFSDIIIEGIVHNCNELLALINSRGADVAIVSMQEPMDVLECLCHQLQQRGVPVLAMAMNNYYRRVEDMQKAGASGYLLKSCRPQELAAAIRTVYSSGEYYCSETIPVARWLKERRAELLKYSGTQLKIMQLLCFDFDTKSMASLLKLTEKTVNFNRKELLKKTGKKTSNGVTMYAAFWKIDEMDLGLKW